MSGFPVACRKKYVLFNWGVDNNSLYVMGNNYLLKCNL